LLIDDHLEVDKPDQLYRDFDKESPPWLAGHGGPANHGRVWAAARVAAGTATLFSRACNELPMAMDCSV
jgi:hypothetical protein